jgi:LL-diaminopimelate aminotransferase
MHNNNVIFIDGNKDNNFLPLPNDSLYGKSYIIYICSPNNPTGASYNKEQLKEWVSFAKKTESLIIYDAAYEAFIDNDVPHSIYEIDGASSIAIEVASFSKFAGFTGIRCGYTIVPSSININGVLLNKLWKRRQSTKFNGVSYITQVAASVALTSEGIKECQKNLCYYKENARLLKEFFKKKGIWFSGGDNSPYIWLECPFGMSSWEFFQFLLEKCNVIGTPGVGFGKNGEGFFRITSFGTKEDTLEAIRRMDLVL